MKNKIIFFASIVLAVFAFVGCSEDDEKATATYTMRVGLGTDSRISSEAPALSTLLDQVETAVDNINAAFTPIVVNGSGKTSEAAKADAQSKAIQEYNIRAEQVFVQLINVKLAFEDSRTELADDIFSTDSKYYIKLYLELYLQDSNVDIVQRGGADDYKMEALGGTDYRNL
jgi:hypothetical protein